MLYEQDAFVAVAEAVAAGSTSGFLSKVVIPAWMPAAATPANAVSAALLVPSLLKLLNKFRVRPPAEGRCLVMDMSTMRISRIVAVLVSRCTHLVQTYCNICVWPGMSL